MTFRLVRIVVACTVLLLVGLVAMSGRDWPPLLVRQMEQFLSRGPISVHAERAAFNLRRGLQLHGLRIFIKRRMGPPALTADEVFINGRLMFNRPPVEWIDQIHAREVTLRDGLLAPGSNTLAGLNGAYSGVPQATMARRAWWNIRPIRLRIEGLNLWQTRIDELTGMLSRSHHQLLLADIVAIPPGTEFNERVAGWARYDLVAGRWVLHASGHLLPSTINPLLERFEDRESITGITRRFDAFSSPPHVELDFEHMNADGLGRPLHQDLRLAIHGTHLAYRDIPITSIDLALQWLRENGNNRLIVSPLRVKHADGSLEGVLSRQPKARATELSLRATLPSEDLAKVLELPVASHSNLVFSTPPTLTLSGIHADTNSTFVTDLRGRLECASIELHDLPLEDCAMTFSLTGNDRLAIHDFQAICHQGGLQGTLEILRPDTNAPARFALSTVWSNVNMTALGAHRGWKEPISGVLDGRLALKGQAGTRMAESLRGEGRIAVKDGAILRIPLFAGLTRYLASTIPGIEGLVMQSDARIPFSVSNGLLRVEQAVIEGNVFSMRGRGQCRLDHAKMPLDGVMQMRFFKQKTLAALMARVVTLPFSKMMEFKVEGPISQPHWTYIGLIDRLRDATWGADDDDSHPEPSGQSFPPPPPMDPDESDQ